MIRHDHSIELLHEVLLTTRHLGAKALKKILFKARNGTDLIAEAIRERISYENHLIKLLCRHFLITRQELMVSKTRNPNRLNALTIGYVITKKTLGYTLQETSYMFKKDQSNINKEIIRFNKFKTDDYRERQMIEACNQISDHLKKFMNINKTAA